MQAVLRRRFSLGLLVAVASVGCNSDDSNDPVQYTIEKAPTKSGDEQTAIVGTKLGNDLRVFVTRDGNAANGVTVSWQTNEGSLNPTSAISDPDGIATTSWTLGPTTGAKAATATISGAIGSPLAFTATAVNPNPTPGGTSIEVLGPAGGNRFQPSAIGVVVGTTVTWHWPAGSVQHNIVPDDGTTPEGSGPLNDGERLYTFKFTAPGVYRFYCANHGGPNGAGMSGIVTVVASQD